MNKLKKIIKYIVSFFTGLIAAILFIFLMNNKTDKTDAENIKKEKNCIENS